MVIGSSWRHEYEPVWPALYSDRCFTTKLAPGSWSLFYLVTVINMAPIFWLLFSTEEDFTFDDIDINNTWLKTELDYYFDACFINLL